MEMIENLNEKEPKNYEIGYLLSPLVAQEAVADTVNSTIRQAIEKAGGVVTGETAPVMRALAYEVKKVVGSKSSHFSDAYFGAINFTAKPTAVAIINEAVDTAEQVLRSMTIIASRPNPIKIRRNPASQAKVETPTAIDSNKATASMTTADIDKEIDGLLAKV